MLIKREYESNKKSIYACDICSAKITVDDINKISRQHKKKNQKIYDLCEDCCELMMRSMKELKEERRKDVKKKR